jgi:hypothetical protein
MQPVLPFSRRQPVCLAALRYRSIISLALPSALNISYSAYVVIVNSFPLICYLAAIAII